MSRRRSNAFVKCGHFRSFSRIVRCFNVVSSTTVPTIKGTWVTLDECELYCLFQSRDRFNGFQSFPRSFRFTVRRNWTGDERDSIHFFVCRSDSNSRSFSFSLYSVWFYDLIMTTLDVWSLLYVCEQCRPVRHSNWSLLQSDVFYRDQYLLHLASLSLFNQAAKDSFWGRRGHLLVSPRSSQIFLGIFRVKFWQIDLSVLVYIFMLLSIF